MVQTKVSEGAKIVGKKIGLTSKVMQQLIGVDEPDYGHILDNMMYEDGDTILLKKYIHPKVEFELAFVLKNDLKGPNVTEEDVLAATDYVVPSIEIIDSRIIDWKIKLEDTVADNGSSAGAVIGKNKIKVDGLDLANLHMKVYQNGNLLDEATSAAVLGNPLRAVAWLANAVAKYDVNLNAGEVILSGALTKAVSVKSCDSFTVQFEDLGNVTATFE